MSNLYEIGRANKLDHNNEIMVNSGECNGKNLDGILVDEPKSDVTIKFQDCQINCLQDIETLNKICQQMNLKFVKPNHLYHRHKRIKPQHPDEYEVEEIVDYVRDKYKEWYLIKWKGWESEFNTWEPYSNLTGCQELIENFHRSGRKANLQNHTNIGIKRKLNYDPDARKENLEKVYKLFMELCKPSAKDLATLFKLKGISLDEFEKSGSNVKKLKRDLKEMLSSSLYNGNETVIRTLEERCDADLIDFARKRKEVLFELKKWETEINTMSEICPVFVENDVDLEGPPQNFIYITDYKAGDGIEIPDDPLVGCECRNCYENQKNCCSMQSGGKFAYTKYGYLKVPKGTPIYECNKRCKCGDDCLNRVVQKGRKIKLAIFRTHDGRGWGVKSLEKIKKGTFIMEYVGEVITSEEAERRGQIYDSEGRTYLFDLDYNADDCPFTVDAAFYGNVSHFMNHSCDPNLAVYGVWINNLDPRLPHIAFFSQRDIKKGEELTFDYLMTNSTSAITSSPTKMSMPSPATEQGTESAVSDESSSTIRNENGLSPSESNETIFVPFDADGDDLSPSSKSETRVVPSSSSPSPSPSVEGRNSPTTNFLPLLSPSKVSQVQARKRIVCKCGAKNCRGYLF